MCIPFENRLYEEDSSQIKDWMDKDNEYLSYFESPVWGKYFLAKVL